MAASGTATKIVLARQFPRPEWIIGSQRLQELKGAIRKMLEHYESRAGA